MKKHSVLNSVAVKTPCTQDWDLMYGNDEMRFCQHCVKHVHDLSAMTRRDAEKLVARAKGSICVRYVRRQDGKIQTASDKLYQISARASRLAAGVFGASLSLASAVLAQDGIDLTPQQVEAAAQFNKGSSKPDQAQKTSKEKSESPVFGTVADQNGAVIPGVKVTLTNNKTGASQTVTSNEEGYYAFTSVEEGVYKLEFNQTFGFINLTIENVSFKTGANVKYDATLEAAAIMGDIAIVAPRYENPLMSAVAENDLERVKLLISQGADVNEKENKGGASALHIAVLGGNLEMIRTLLKFGAKVNMRDEQRETPMMQISVYLYSDEESETELTSPGTQIFNLLITYGAKVNLRDSQGYTALMRAARGEAPSLLRALIAHKADVNIQAKDGRTALMEAVAEGELENVKILLEAGADVDLKDEDGQTALALAGDCYIVQLLISYGAKPEEPEEEPQEEPEGEPEDN